MLAASVSDLSSRAIQTPARLRYSGFWLTTRMELSRLIGLELDHALAEAAFAGIHDLLELGNQRFRRAVAHRENADRLSLHPVGIEAQDGVDRGRAVGAAAGNDQGIAAGVRTHRGGLDAEGIQQLEYVLRRDIAQRHHADALAGFRRARCGRCRRGRLRWTGAADSRAAVAHQRDAGHLAARFPAHRAHPLSATGRTEASVTVPCTRGSMV